MRELTYDSLKIQEHKNYFIRQNKNSTTLSQYLKGIEQMKELGAKCPLLCSRRFLLSCDHTISGGDREFFFDLGS